MEWLCGGPAPRRWDDVCHLDLAAAGAAGAHLALLAVAGPVWCVFRRTGRGPDGGAAPAGPPARLRHHSARWLLALLAALVSLAALMDAVLGEWYSRVWHVHVVAAPAAALLAVGSVVGLAAASERDAAPARLLLNALYLAVGAALAVLKVRFYESVPGLGPGHARVDLAWALTVVYGLWLVLEVHFIFAERVFCSKSKFTFTHPDKTDVEDVAYLHPFANALQKITFSWMTSLLKRGFNRPIEFTDLGRPPPGEDTLPHFLKLRKTLQRVKGRSAGSGSDLNLWHVIWLAHWRSLLLGGFLKLCGDLVGLVAPLALKNIIDFVLLHQSGSLQMQQLDHNGYLYPTVEDFLSNGYVMSVVALVAALAQGTFSQYSTHVMVTEGIRLRSEVQALVYEKSLRIPSMSSDWGATSKNGTLASLGSASSEAIRTAHIDSGSLIDLLSEDAVSLTELLSRAHYIWAIPLKITILLVLLHRQLGISAVIGALVSVFVLTPVQFVIVKLLQSNKNALKNKSNERLSLTAEFIAGIRLLKLNALEFIYEKKIQHVRKKELKLLWKDSIYLALSTFLTQASLTVVMLTTFGLFSVLEEAPLVSSNVFSGLALFNQLTVPLFVLPVVVKAIIDAAVSLRRLKLFLTLSEVEELCEGRQRPQEPGTAFSQGSDKRHSTGAPTSSASTATSRSLSSTTSSRRERPGSLELASPEPTSPRSAGSPPAAWGSQDSVFALEQIPEGDEEFTATEASDEEESGDEDSDFVPREPAGRPRSRQQRPETGSQSPAPAGQGQRPAGTDAQLAANAAAGTEPSAEEETTAAAEGDRAVAGTDDSPPRSDGGDGPVRPVEPLSLRAARPVRPPEAPRPGLPEPAVTVRGASFCWSSGPGALALTDINLTVPRGQLVMIVGPVGSGKSSLVSALLGEMRTRGGTVTWARNTSLAYASQSPWLFNDSLRNNILFGRQLAPRRYRRVVAACALEEDIGLLVPDGDRTVIGEQGSMLSGGQRQRVAVARALYSTASCVILDDPLSALDVHVGSHLFENGIKKLLLKDGRTVILVTHKLQYLKHADQVIALEEGRIRQQGTLPEIAAADPALYGRWKQLIRLDKRQESEQPAVETRTARERWRLLQLVQKASRPGPLVADLNRDKFSSFRRTALRRHSSLRHHISHMLPMSLDAGSEEYSTLPRRRWTTTSRRSPAPAALPAERTVRQPYRRSSSVRPATPGSPDETAVAGGGEQALALQRMMSSPPNMPSPRQPRSGSVSEGGRQLLGWIKRRNTSAQRTPSSDDVRKAPPEQAVPLVSQDPTPTAPSRPPLTRAVSAASTYSGMFCDEDDETEVDSNRFSNEERERGKISKLLYLTYMQACGYGFAVLYLAMVLFTQASHVTMDYWLSRWSDAASQWNRTHQLQWQAYLDSQEARSARPRRNVTEAYQEFVASETSAYLWVYSALAVAGVLLALAANVSGQQAGARARRRLHARLLAAITRGRKDFFDRTPAGRVLDRFSRDVSLVDKKTATAIHILLFFVLQCFTAVIVNAVVTWWFIFIALVIGAIYYFLQKFYRSFSIELQRLDGIAHSPVLSHFAETQTGLAVIRAFGHQGRFFDDMLQYIDLHLVTSLIYESGQRWLGIALDYLGAVIVFLSSVISVSVALADEQGAGSALVGLAINYTLLIPMYLVWVVRSLSDVELNMCAMERVHKYTMLKTEDYRKKLIVSPGWPRHGKIEFIKASLGYASDGDGSSEPVLKDLNLTIEPGQKVALVGRSGSGKSTLALALFQMSDLLEGSILIDGKDLNSVPLQAIRSQLALIPQEPLLFSGSIRSNLDPICDKQDEQLWRALELVQMKEYVKKMGHGLESEVQEGGENLSVGQRQLLCLARAVLREARVVVLDEPTSSLDAETERTVQEVVRRQFARSTVVTIAHQIATVLEFDLLLVLDGGRVAEQGPPRQLAARRDGLFATMLRAAREQGASLTDRLT